MKISIITPVYNVKDYIIECLESIANQTMTEGVECILIDDCGQDESIAIAEEWVRGYRSKVLSVASLDESVAERRARDCVQFKILRQTHNQGPSSARNMAIREATGEYIFCLDSDDTIMPECLEGLYNLAKKYDADYVQGLYVHDNGKNQFTTYRLPEFTDDRKFIKATMLDAAKIHFTPHNKLIRRQMVLENALFFREGIIHEDAHWMFFMAKCVSRMAIFHKTTYFLRPNPTSLVHTPNFELEVRSYRALIEDCSQNIDNGLVGLQKEFVLNNLLIVFEHQFYHSDQEKQQLINEFRVINKGFENVLFEIFLMIPSGTLKSKYLHLFLRIIKRND